ncbi:hypothetical protein [Neorhodopirellula lusitana]|uniref:hypothetical protein n=1 Tax=Neorhodopirellula lusitana TaxID=445327 RepID=UPI00384B778C
MSVVEAVKNIASRKQQAKKSEQQKKADLRKSFESQVAIHVDGGIADTEIVSQWVDQFDDPIAVWDKAVSVRLSEVRQTDLRKQLAALQPHRDELGAERRRLSETTRWKDGLILDSGPLARPAMTAKRKLDETARPTTEQLADYRIKMRAWEDSIDRLRILEHEVSEIDAEIQGIADSLVAVSS